MIYGVAFVVRFLIVNLSSASFKKGWEFFVLS